MQRFKGRRTTLIGSTALALLVAMPAVAAEAQPATDVSEVVVTANKREERLQDVGQAVTAVGEQTLERISANEFQDYAKLVPGLSLNASKPGQTVLALRGISSFSAGSTVGVYVDDTPYGSSSGLSNGQFYTVDLNTYDLERVEVLKGPQGTLYGASTLGGLVKFVTNRPEPGRYGGSVQGAAESVDDGDLGWSVKGMVNLPLGDKAALRVAAVHLKDPGFIGDPSRGLEDVNDSTQTGLRVSLLANLADNFTLRLSATGQNSEFNSWNAMDVVSDAESRVRLPIEPLTGDLQLSQAEDTWAHSRYRIYNATAEWDLGWGSLVSATSYGTLGQIQRGELSTLGTVLSFSSARQTKFTQELRLASKPNERLEWIVGGYFTRETSELATEYQGLLSGVVDLEGSGVGVDSTFRETAAFATLTYHFTPTFDVAVGGRYARNTQTQYSWAEGLFAADPQTGKSWEDVFLYSVAPRWRPNANTTVYGRIASGYRPGGPNVVPPGTAAAAPNFDADKVLSAELGVRADLLDNRLSLDVSAFHIRWKDIQLIGTMEIGDFLFSVTQNGGEAESQGVEWAAVARPLAGLSLGFTGAYIDAKLTEDTTPEVGGLDGDPLPFTPKWSGALSADYEWPAFGDVQAFVGATWSYVGDRHSDIGVRGAPDEQIELPSYDTVDLRAGLRRGDWTLQVYAKNLNDERGVTGIGFNDSAAANDLAEGDFARTVSVIRPRTIGVSLSGRF